jgi:hypothetical protein
MARYVLALAGGWLVLAIGAAHAADNPAARTWKFTITVNTQRGPLPLSFLIMLSESDKGFVGDVLGISLALPKEPKFESLIVKDDQVSFTIKIEDKAVGFDGRLAKDGKRIRGSLTFAGATSLIDLKPSKLKNMTDKFAVAKDSLDNDEGLAYFDAVFDVLAQCTAKKVKADEVRAIADKAAKMAEEYGPRWQRTVLLRMASSLVSQEAFVAIALEQTRQVERMLKPDDDASTQMEVLQSLAATLRKAKKNDDLKSIESRLTKLEARDYAEYAKKYPPFKPEEYKGRKNKSDRAVLVELFTGAECPPCVASDLAFDALQSTYKPADVVLLQYHLHIPGPDPLTNKAGLERAESYGDKIRGTPTIFFNGKRDETGGGRIAQAKLKYTTYRETIDDLLEKEAGAKLQLSASQKGSDINIKANVADLAKPGDKVALRFALIEERVRYQGGNGLRFHHCVVRAFPGGAKGFALTKKDAEQTATINLDKLRDEIGKYLDAMSREDDFPNNDRPLALKNLRVVAFIQDDASGEVLQAAQVEVEEKKGE